MKCQEAESEILSRLEGSSSSSELKKHLEYCSDCTALMAESAAMDSLCHNVPILEPSPFLWTRIESRLGGQPPSGWTSWLPRAIPAWVTVTLLILLSFFFTTFENQTSIDPEQMLAQSGLTSEIVDTNPFLVAQTSVVNGSNPFLEAMMPGGAKPFEPQRAP